MKRYNIRMIASLILLLLSFILYNNILSNYYIDKELRDYNLTQLDNYYSDFEDNIIKFIPYRSSYMNEFETDEEFVQELYNDLEAYGYKGAIPPSKMYKTKLNNRSITCMVLDELYTKEYDFKFVDDIGFNYVPMTLNDICVYLHESMSESHKIGSVINLKIQTKEEDITYDINAKVSGYIKDGVYDPINLRLNNTPAIYLPNIQHLFDKDITYKNNMPMFSLVFNNLQESNEDIHIALSQYGAIVDFDYANIFKNEQQRFSDILPFYNMFIVIVILLLTFSTFVTAYQLATLSKDCINNKEYNKRIRYSLIFLFICLILYAVINTILGVISNTIINLLPYLIILGLILFSVIYNRRTLNKEDKK